MFGRILISCGVFALAIPGASARDEPKGDKAKLEGEWSAVSLEDGAGKTDEATLKKFRLVIKDDLRLSTVDGHEMKNGFKLDESKNP